MCYPEWRKDARRYFSETKSTCEIVRINSLAQNSEVCTWLFVFGYSRRSQRTFHTLPWRAGGGEQRPGAFPPVWGSGRTCLRRQAARSSCTASRRRPGSRCRPAAASGIWPIGEAQSCPKCGESQVVQGTWKTKKNPLKHSSQASGQSSRTVQIVKFKFFSYTK